MALKVLVLHGPNSPLWRDGERTLESLEAELVARAQALGVELVTFAGSSEGALLDELLRRKDWADAFIVNPSSLAPVAYALADALELIGKPAVEVQLAHESKGRGRSALRKVVEKQFHGQGFGGYSKALEALAKAPAPGAGKSVGGGTKKAEEAPGEERARAAKTIGKAKGNADRGPAPSPRNGKSIGRRETREASGSGATGGGLTRTIVRLRLAERLQKKTTPEAFAAWAQTQYQALKSGAAVEAGQAQLLEDTLLFLAASARVSDELLITTLAKLEP